MGVLDRAATHLRRQANLARRIALEVAKLWSRVDEQAIAATWRAQVPAATAIVTAGQLEAAKAADGYVDGLVTDYGLRDRRRAAVRPETFAGVASDGRGLDTLLFQPVITSLKAIRARERQAVLSGRFALERIVRTQIEDAGRAADGVSLTASIVLTGYVRMLSLPSCSRCIILAGAFYQWNDGFERHDLCDCRHIPANENVEGDLRTDPQLAFESMTAAEQDRTFTKAGARAVRDGANLAQIVNARRGIYIAGGLLATTVGATRRRARLMPESIYDLSGDDRDEALRLLRENRFLR